MINVRKMIFWNIRSVNTQNSFERLIDLNKRHHYLFIALLEPFQDPQELEQYKKKTRIHKCSGQLFNQNLDFLGGQLGSSSYVGYNTTDFHEIQQRW